MKVIRKLVIATSNPGKKDRYAKLFVGLVDNLLSLIDLNITEKAPETGITAEENAELKARFYLAKTKLPTFSEDEALYVDFLPEDKQPGVHVRRIDGKNEVSDEELLAYWEKVIADIPPDKRTGRWHMAFCLALPNGDIKISNMDYPIMFYPKSKKIIKGWPLSAIQGSPLIGKPHSEYTEEDSQMIVDKTAELLQRELKSMLEYPHVAASRRRKKNTQS